MTLKSDLEEAATAADKLSEATGLLLDGSLLIDSPREARQRWRKRVDDHLCVMPAGLVDRLRAHASADYEGQVARQRARFGTQCARCGGDPETPPPRGYCVDCGPELLAEANDAETRLKRAVELLGEPTEAVCSAVIFDNRSCGACWDCRRRAFLAEETKRGGEKGPTE